MNPKIIAYAKQGVPLTNQQWFELLEIRREEFKPFLTTITLPKVGDIELEGGTWRDTSHGLSDDHPLVAGSAEFPRGLETQAVFVKADFGESQSSSNNSYLALFRETGYWFLVTVDFEKDKAWEIAKKVTLCKITPDEIVQRMNCEILWVRFGYLIHQLCNERRKALEDLFALEKAALSENKLMDLFTTA